MAPALKIPLSFDLASLDAESKKMGDRMGEALRVVGRKFADVNGEILGVAKSTAGGAALAWGQSGVRMALIFGTIATAGVAAFKLIGSVVATAREQIEDMVKVADKAQARQLSAEGFQAFTRSTGPALDKVQELEDAVSHFYDQTKAKLDININPRDIEAAKVKWDELRTTVSGLRIDLLDSSAAADRFLNSSDNTQRLRAALEIIQQLYQQGQKLEALDFAEKAFGSKFAENLRIGKTSINEIVTEFDRLRVEGVKNSEIFSNGIVAHAKELDDRLRQATERLSSDMHPTLEAVADVVLQIKSLWVDIVELISKGVREMSRYPGANPISGPIAGDVGAQAQALEREREFLAKQRQGILDGGDAESLAGLKTLDDRIDAVTERIRELRVSLRETDRAAAEALPLPRSRPLNAPSPPAAAAAPGRDRFDGAADSIEKRIASMIAETQHIDENTAARERAKVAAQLEEVAKQANAARGLGENVILDEQRARIDQVAEAYGRAALAIERAHSPLATFARESQDVSKALNQFAATTLDSTTNALVSITFEWKNAAQTLKNLTQSILQDLAKLAVRKFITGPIAGLLGFADGGAVGTSFNPLNTTGSLYDEGGYTGPGGRRTPAGIVHRGEYVFDAPSTARIGINNLEMLRRGHGYADGGLAGLVSSLPTMASPVRVGGGLTVTLISAPTYETGIGAADMAMIEASQQRNNTEMRTQVMSDLRELKRNNPEAFDF